jgi:hypothetical protein
MRACVCWPAVVKLPEPLVDGTALFLHRLVADLQNMLDRLHRSDDALGEEGAGCGRSHAKPSLRSAAWWNVAA